MAFVLWTPWDFCAVDWFVISGGPWLYLCSSPGVLFGVEAVCCLRVEMCVWVWWWRFFRMCLGIGCLCLGTYQKNRTHQHQNRSKYQDIDTQYQDTFGKNIYPPKHSTIILTHTFLPAGNRPPQHRTTHQEKNTSTTKDPQRWRTNQQHKNTKEFIGQKPIT